MQSRPDEQRIQIGLCMFCGLIAMFAAQILSQQIKRMLCMFNELRMLSGLWPGRAEHQPIFQWFILSVGDVTLSHPRKPDGLETRYLITIEVVCKLDEAASHDLGQQMVTTRKMPVRCLMGYTQFARHIAHA